MGESSSVFNSTVLPALRSTLHFPYCFNSARCTPHTFQRIWLLKPRTGSDISIN